MESSFFKRKVLVTSSGRWLPFPEGHPCLWGGSLTWWTLQSPSSWGFGCFRGWGSGICDVQKSIVRIHNGWWGVSMLPIREGVYPSPVNSGWNVPDRTPDCPVSMGRCVASATSITGWSTSIASVASRNSVDSLPVSPGSLRSKSRTATASSLR